MEQAFNLVKDDGYVSLIVPNVWLNNTYSEKTRKLIIQKSLKLKLAEPTDKVFDGISVDTIIFISQVGTPDSSSVIEVDRISMEGSKASLTLPTTLYADGKTPISTSTSVPEATVIDKIIGLGIPLANIAEVTRGVHPYRTGGFGKSAFGEGNQTQRDVDERPYHSKEMNEKNGYRPFIYGKDLKRFEPLKITDYVKYGKWLAEPRDPKFFEGERIYSRKILGKRLVLTIEKGNSIADQQVYITKVIGNQLKVEYLAGILGSKLMAFYIRKFFNEQDDLFPQIKVTQLKNLPIRILDLDEKTNSEKYKSIISNVEALMKLKKELKSERLPATIEQLMRKVEYIEDKINENVYKLYDLESGEIKLIESYGLL